MAFLCYPPWKRARYAKPTEPKSLRDLAMDAFIEELQDQLVVDVSKIPTKFGDDIWKKMTTCEILDRFASQNRYNTDAIVSVLPSTDFKVRYDIVQWLCKFFQCKVRTFEFEDSKFCSYWNFLEEPGDLKIERCTDLDFANRVLPERQRNNLSTTVSRFRIDEPIRITTQSIQQARTDTAYFNFTTSDFDKITSFYKEMIPEVRTICTKVLNWTADQLETFKSELGLEDYSDELLETYRAEKFMEDSEQKWYKLLENGKAVVVYVNEKEPEVYDQIGCTRWYKKV